MDAKRLWLPIPVLLAAEALLALFVFAISTNATDLPEIRAGSELDFRPYCFTDENGQPTGFGVELLRAVADKATLRMSISPREWDRVWNGLVAGEIDVLPVVARTPGREGLVDFTLPHTETFDAFFIRVGEPPIKDLAAAAGKEIVVLRSDAAHHQLVERKFPGKVVPVDSIVEGLRRIASGKHDAMLCSRLIGVLERDQARIAGVTDGPVIPDYKRVFSFAVRKGNTELVERLNQGLRLVQADGTYDRLYRKWLGVEKPPSSAWEVYFWQAIGILGVLVLLAVTWVVARKALESDRLQSQALTPQRRAFGALAVCAGGRGRGGGVRDARRAGDVGRARPAHFHHLLPGRHGRGAVGRHRVGIAGDGGNGRGGGVLDLAAGRIRHRFARRVCGDGPLLRHGPVHDGCR